MTAAVAFGPSTRQPIAAVRGARKIYQGVLALDGVDFSVAPGEVRALLGKNGAGKSTLIRLLTGAETPDTGTVAVAGAPLTGEARTRPAAASASGRCTRNSASCRA